MTTCTSLCGAIPWLYSDILRQPHTLIAGASGSGKSTLLHGLICSAAQMHPNEARLLLIDPKRVELWPYAALPHTIAHATEPPQIVAVLALALQIIDERLRAMQRANVTMYHGASLYVIVDELADLMTTQSKRITPLLQRIAQIGRAARVHLIAATQCPLAKIIPTEIKVNLTALVGLHTLTQQHSRNIIDTPGCEQLPMYGECIYRTPEGLHRYTVPYTTPEQIAAAVARWAPEKPQKPPRRRWWQRIA